MTALRVLTFTTLYPNAAKPNHGVFVENRLRQTLARHDLRSTVVAPVPFFPFTAEMFGAYARFARAPELEVRHGVEVHHPRYLSIPKIGMNVAATLLYRGGLTACRLHQLNSTTIDVIDAHYFYPDGVAAAWLSKALGIPFVVTSRGTDLNVLANFPRVRRQILWAAEQAAAVITVSGALRERAIEVGIDARKIAVLRNGVDLDQFTPQDREAARRQFGASGFTVVSVGNLVPLKGHDLTIEAVASMPDATLLIAGGGPLRDALGARAAALGVADRVKLLGEVQHQQLARLYSAADVSVLMSEREGWANVLLESMACGTAVVATRVGGNAEAITSPAAGALLPERSARALAEALRAFRRSPNDRTATRRHAEAFGWGAVAAGNFALLKAASTGETARRAASEIVGAAMRQG
ncbi:MAG: glycosyltransferase [Alphaproteobacteria bacterium]|nr:glycosyltransferase [Alphaproteobacteria bacterium]